MKRFALAFVAIAAVGSVSANASAQAWLGGNRQAAQGPGIMAGGLELHPGFAAEAGYDSNYFNRAPRGGSSGLPIVDTVRLRLTPSFYVNTPGEARRPDGSKAPPPTVIFSAGGALAWNEYLMNQDRLGRNRDIAVLGDLIARFNPGRPWGFNVFNNFQRVAQPALVADNEQLTAGLNRLENRAAGEIVHTRPGGLFDWRLGYAFAITKFEAGLAQDLSNNRHEIYTGGRWRFLPRTAFVYDGSIWFLNYDKPTPGLSNSRPLRTRIGLAGLITDRLSLLAMVGWGASFYQNAGTGTRDFDSVIGQAELRYFLQGSAPEAGQPAPTTLSSVALGFTRDFFNSYIGNYFERNRGYVSFMGSFSRRFLLTLDAGIAAVRFADVLDRRNGTVMSTSFVNGRVDALLFAEYRVTDWLGINTTFQYNAELSNKRLRFLTSDPNTWAMEFHRFQALGGVRAFW